MKEEKETTSEDLAQPQTFHPRQTRTSTSRASSSSSSHQASRLTQGKNRQEDIKEGRPKKRKEDEPAEAKESRYKKAPPFHQSSSSKTTSLKDFFAIIPHHHLPSPLKREKSWRQQRNIQKEDKTEPAIRESEPAKIIHPSHFQR